MLVSVKYTCESLLEMNIELSAVILLISPIMIEVEYVIEFIVTNAARAK